MIIDKRNMSKHTEEILERIAGEDLRKKVIILNKKRNNKMKILS